MESSQPHELVGPKHRACLWCADAIVIERRPGRPRIYCGRSCRQRAYERRSGHGVIPPIERRIEAREPTNSVDPRRQRRGYERGRLSFVHGRSHALRFAGRSDLDGRRSTLCGAMASPVNGQFVGGADNSCQVCATVERIRPSHRAPQPSQDLAHLRAVLDDAGVWFDRRRTLHGAAGSVDVLLQRLVNIAY
jgi:hypothetical protein